jgi:predicted ATPase/DNA-binding SARP family transcriptional activator
MARLILALLGPLHVSLDGQPVSSFGYDKVRALLAYLAVEAHRPHARDALAALLWPEEPASVARKNLRSALTTLRQAIGDAGATPPFLLISRDTLQLNPAGDRQLDVASFTGLLAEVERHAHPEDTLCGACAARLAQAAELYRGEFATRLDSGHSAAWEEWAMLMRERLHGLMLDALAQLMAYHEARGDDEAARRYAWRALALEGWDEAAQRCLMRILARAGQRGAALAQYERCRKLLAEELGVEPAAETTALYQRIRSGPLERVVGATATRRSPTNGVSSIDASAHKPLAYAPSLPIPPTPLIGRDADVAAAAERLSTGGVRLLTLVGPPGVGKTRLGLAVASALYTRFDGVCFVSLVPLRDPARLADAIAGSLQVAARGGRPLIELLIGYLREKRTLLLLDNFEHLLDAAPLVAELLAACPQLTVLATSRAPLHVRAERLFAVEPLALPGPAGLTDVVSVAQSPAVALLVERVQAARPDFCLTDAHVATVAAICARLEGLPLAIELAAAHVMPLGAETLLAQLDRRLAILTNGPRDLPQHQQALRTALAWSFDLLAPHEQAVFVALGVCRGGCDLDVLRALCAVEPIEQLRPIVRTLVDQQLVRRAVAGDGDERVTMLETMREYALERLQASDTLSRCRELHARYFLALAERADPALHGPLVLKFLAQLERERDNMRAALEWCGEAADRAHVGLQLASALWPYWLLRGHFAEGRAWLAAFLARPIPAVSPATEARGRLAAGWLAYCQDDYAAAAAYGHDSLKLYRCEQDQAGQAEALNLLGFCVAAHGDYLTAVAQLAESVALARAAGALYTLAFALLNLGFLYADQEAAEQAREQFEESLVWARRIPHPVLITRALNGLGELARLQGDYARAEAQYAQSLQLYEALADRRGIAALQHNLGCVALFHEDTAEAHERFLRSLAGYRELGDRSGMAAALAGLAGVIGLQGQAEQAARLFGAAYAARAAMRVPFIVPDRLDYERGLAAIRAQLGAIAFDAAWALGQTLSLELALAEASGQVQLEVAQ